MEEDKKREMFPIRSQKSSLTPDKKYSLLKITEKIQ